MIGGVLRIEAMTIGGAFLNLIRNPKELLVRRWNWKSAVLSPLFRSQIFLAVNLRAGWKAALGAMAAEFAYRAMAAGFCGALTQSFRDAEPAWVSPRAAPAVVRPQAMRFGCFLRALMAGIARTAAKQQILMFWISLRLSGEVGFSG